VILVIRQALVYLGASDIREAAMDNAVQGFTVLKNADDVVDADARTLDNSVTAAHTRLARDVAVTDTCNIFIHIGKFNLTAIMASLAVTAPFINNGLGVRCNLVSINTTQAFTELGPIRVASWPRGMMTILHRMEKLLEPRSFPLWKSGHLFDEFCCAHMVNLAQLRTPAKWLFLHESEQGGRM
jgi:hypothetical protein